MNVLVTDKHQGPEEINIFALIWTVPNAYMHKSITWYLIDIYYVYGSVLKFLKKGKGLLG